MARCKKNAFGDQHTAAFSASFKGVLNRNPKPSDHPYGFGGQLALHFSFFLRGSLMESSSQLIIHEFVHTAVTNITDSPFKNYLKNFKTFLRLRAFLGRG